jgi:hypothetical protein
VPPEFIDQFIKKGWRAAEHSFGKSSAQIYRRAVGRQRLTDAHRQYLADKKRDPRVDVVAYRMVLARRRKEEQ